MRLRSITLENFGLYAGRQRLDLLPARARPVVLIGGKNGAGKTTLLEAVRLALYGRRALGYRVAQSEYEEHLRRRLHVGSDGRPAPFGSVGLEFDYAEGGVVHRYEVLRRWATRGTKTVETLTLEKDGAPVDAVPRDEWHSFLQEMIPPGVSQLFFFDGEKIAEIARDDPDEGLAEAVRGLLGIELVGRLRTDLGLYLARHGRREGNDEAVRLETIVREISVLDRRIAEMAEDVAELTSRHASQSRVALNVRQRFIAEGGDAANRRAQIEASRDELRQQITRREAEIREFAGGLLPFASAPRLLRRFSVALAHAGEKPREDMVEFRERVGTWRKTNTPTRTARWQESHWRDLDAFFESEQQRATGAAAGTVSELDAGDRRGFAARLVEARENIASRAALAVSELDSLQRKLRRVDADLVRASGHAAGIVLDELLSAEKSVGTAEAVLRARTDELHTLEFQRSGLTRERDRMLKAQTEAEAGEERAALATRVGRALQLYEERLLDMKLAQLQTEFVSRFNHLARKGGFVANVRIDRTSFDATLIDKTGAEIPKSSLSAGEKQVYAIAMLWALARTSGRALPMIIDTPLARLDSEHRTAIVERYFPEASHQVIVLSTDTEVDARLLKELTPSISHSYRLDYEPDQRATRAIPGYFGDGDEGGQLALQQA
ncbi:DNA sulfur modification protein DndD [Mesorhizobium humile]|uniref:DNA sulfur modification protein DndD n=1 Tax=Mesorhizobium humile TaxID=3072313 RepID=A0ABU4YN08_9HYPH|nr:MULTISPECIES: DNA sulfur modification protein DndD [unclassified Mesorhizobium]MDX8463285.1 DNA sulfur modification protein DndD [Mesorhizobium sp. VK2D]MDX8488371.1 DNA sulfur modification protein DndD [Mesorhizobium sp. VK2B]